MALCRVPPAIVSHVAQWQRNKHCIDFIFRCRAEIKRGSKAQQKRAPFNCTGLRTFPPPRQQRRAVANKYANPLARAMQKSQNPLISLRCRDVVCVGPNAIIRWHYFCRRLSFWRTSDNKCNKKK